MPAEARVTAALLQQGRRLDHLSGALLLLGVLLGLGQLLAGRADPVLGIVCLALVLLGLVQKYWALRVAFDAALFDRLDTLSLAELDSALHGLGLVKQPQVDRTLAERGRGALRLLQRQGLCLLAQGLFALGGLIHAVLAATPG